MNTHTLSNGLLTLSLPPALPNLESTSTNPIWDDSQNAKAWPLANSLAMIESKELETRRTYQRRIKELERFGALDNIAPNSDSKKDFWHFVTSEPAVCKAGLVLLDNGNLRAVWKGSDKSRIGMEFRGGRMIRYVIFKYSPAGKSVRRIVGTATLDEVKQQICKLDLKQLVYG